MDKKEDSFKIKDALFDFNTGYLTTIILGLSFLSLGAFVMYGSGEVFSNSGGEFAKVAPTRATEDELEEAELAHHAA